MAIRFNFLLGVLLAAICSASPAVLAAQVTLNGEVTYRERIALPEGAALRVRLIDTTAVGTPTRVEAQAAIAMPGQVPLTFTLNFDDRVVDPAHEHALIAEITSGLDLWFRNSTPYPLKPLAPEEDISVVVNFTGRVAQTGTGVAEDVVPIVDLNWRALAINGRAVAPDSASTLSITSDMRAGGKGGCNNYFAQVELDAAKVTFSAIASTKMACMPDSLMQQEQLFFEALAAARLWRMDGTELVMLSAENREVLRFAVSPR
jgi:putative lipoprotein